MPWNGVGAYTIVNSFTPNTVIASSQVNANFTDIASDGFAKTLPRDGQAAMTAQLKVVDGTVGTPGVGFANDTDVGFRRSGTNEMRAVTAGVDAGTWDANGHYTAPNNLTVGKQVILSGDLTPAQITSNQDDYNPANLANALTLRLSTDAFRNITGLAGGTPGRVIVIHNIGPQFFQLLDESASPSSAANRFAIGSGLSAAVLAVDDSITLKYDGTSSRWRPCAPLDPQITALTAETAPAVDDEFPLKDVSAGLNRKMRLDNVFKVINGFTEETAVDPAADFLPLYDASAATADKVKPSAIGGLPLLTSGTVTNAATLDIVLTAYTGYRGILIVLSDFIPATDAVELLVRLSTDGGSTYDAGAGAYSYAVNFGNDGGAGPASSNSTSATAMRITDNDVGNGAAEGYSGLIKLLGQTNTALWPKILTEGHHITSHATPRVSIENSAGTRRAAQDTDAIRFLYGSGNISSGKYAAYGLA